MRTLDVPEDEGHSHVEYKKTVLLVIVCIAVACKAQRSLEVEPAPPSSPTAQSRVTIRSGGLDLRAKDLVAVKAEVNQRTSDAGGWVESWSLSNKRLHMILRIPELELDRTMDALATLGKVTDRRIRSRDVTDELIDLEARLNNLTALRDRLRSYLKEATNLKEILEVERELARVQAEIESLEAKLDRLRSQVAMSELAFSAWRSKWWN